MSKEDEIRDDIRYQKENIKSYFTGEHPDIGDLIESIEALIDLRIQLANLSQKDIR